MKVLDQLTRIMSTGYTLFLLLLSAYILIFRDRKSMKKKQLKRESRFALIAGLALAVIGMGGYILGNLSYVWK